MYLYLRDSIKPTTRAILEKNLMQAGCPTPVFKYHPKDVIKANIVRNRTNPNNAETCYVFMPSYFTDYFVRTILAAHKCSLDRIPGHVLNLEEIKRDKQTYFGRHLQSSSFIYYYQDEPSGFYSFMLSAIHLEESYKFPERFSPKNTIQVGSASILPSFDSIVNIPLF